MESTFLWNMALCYCSRVLFESSRWCCQTSWLVYPLLWRWPRALDKQFTFPWAISQIIAQHTPTSPNSICPRDDDCTPSIHLLKHVGLVFKDSYGLIWPMIVNMQKWFMIFNLLIQYRQYLAVQLLQQGYASLQSWFHAFQIRLQ